MLRTMPRWLTLSLCLVLSACFARPGRETVRSAPIDEGVGFYVSPGRAVSAAELRSEILEVLRTLHYGPPEVHERPEGLTLIVARPLGWKHFAHGLRILVEPSTRVRVLVAWRADRNLPHLAAARDQLVAALRARFGAPLPKSGEGELRVEVTDGPMRVAAPETDASCTTPCTLRLPLGTQTLRLRRDGPRGMEGGELSPLVLPEPSVLTHTLPRRVVLHPVRRRVALASYWTGMAALLSATLMTLDRHPSDGARATRRGLAGAGGAAWVLSFTLVIGTTHWELGKSTQLPAADLR